MYNVHIFLQNTSRRGMCLLSWLHVWDYKGTLGEPSGMLLPGIIIPLPMIHTTTTEETFDIVSNSCKVEKYMYNLLRMAWWWEDVSIPVRCPINRVKKQKVYNCIIFLSLNLAKNCQVISQLTHSQQVIWQWSNHMCKNVQWWFFNPSSDSPEISLIRTKSAGTEFLFRANGVSVIRKTR